jgi:hypothetical protein
MMTGIVEGVRRPEIQPDRPTDELPGGRDALERPTGKRQQQGTLRACDTFAQKGS